MHTAENKSEVSKATHQVTGAEADENGATQVEVVTIREFKRLERRVGHLDAGSRVEFHSGDTEKKNTE